MGHKIKHKIKEKKQEVVEEEQVVEEYNDQFVEIANEALDKAINYKYWILGVVVATVIAVGGYSIYLSGQKASMLKESNAFSEAASVLDAEVINNSEATGQFKTNEEKLNAAIEKLEVFKKNHKSSKLVVIANLNIANSYYELSKFKEAISYYDKFITATTDDTLKEVALLRKGMAYKELKDYDKAISTLEKLNSSKNSYIAPASLFQMGEVYTLKKDTAKAKTFFERIVKEHDEKSLFGQKAKSKL